MATHDRSGPNRWLHGSVAEAVVIHEGNVRRITIKQEGHTIAEFPLTFGVVGAALAPALAAIGAIAALVTDCTIEIERDDDPPAGVGS